MDIYKEIQRIIEYQNSINLRRDRKNEDAVAAIIASVTDSYKASTFDFSKYKNITLNQSGSIRNTKSYEEFSPEETLCIYLKRLLDRKFHIKYPNRNNFMHSLFDILNAVKDMNDYTIVKFDFENFFNTVSSIYVYKKFVEGSSLERYQKDLMANFVEKTRYTYAGFNTSNILCEIAANLFDDLLKLKLKDLGLIYYRRYIDDGLLIFNRYISSSLCLQLINEVIQTVFYDPLINCKPKCKTKLNNAKTKHIAKKDLDTTAVSNEFDFLGYLFVLKTAASGKTDFLYGITQKKIDKYTDKIKDIINDYGQDPNRNIEILRHQIKAFTSRTVYRITKYKSGIWKTKGFISNYCELRYRIDKLTPETDRFLKEAVINAFINANISLPYFLKTKSDESIYSLFNNLVKNKTLLFVDLIGINLPTLKKMCKQVCIPVEESKGYDGLVRDYLIKVKVGH